MGFTEHRPPSRALLDACVHCGFCLPTCPTYALSGEEADSPRGRIHLISQALDGAPLEGAVTVHLDRCLSCLACVSACPSGVRYDEVIEAARAQIERNVRRPRADRVVRAALFAVFPNPARLRQARRALAVAERLGLVALSRRGSVARRLPPRLRALASLAPPARPLVALPARLAALGERRATVGLLAGCVQSVFFSEVNAATARVLAAYGFEVVVPEDQGCCGALAGHAGRERDAIAAAKTTIATFEAAGVDLVVANAAGCGSAMKAYGRLLADEPGWADRAEHLARRTRDLSEVLADAEPRGELHPVPVAVAFHDACHLAHAQGIRHEPRAVLGHVPGLELREVADGELCCGSAGVYNLLQPDTARALGAAKVNRILETGAATVVTSNPGCLLQIGAAAREAGASVDALHLAQVLDASLRGTPLPAAPP